MKSPRFDIRAGTLGMIFDPTNIERVWTKKVRVSMREQFLNDGIENFDFHINRKIECRKLSKLILSGAYVPHGATRILVEKSKGLCRQLVIPTLRDAIVLQCLSDALYLEICKKAPTSRSFYQPKEHRFSTIKSEYGTFAAWLNFQRELFNFSKTRPYIVVTDIANYYDSISYVHLRNVISSMTGADESVLDMLIHVLSALLWQPDYMPRVEIGLPQINLDAPRLLAHCFLYELDAFLASDTSRDFVRYMDDIDIGVNSIVEAKRVLQSVDLVLQVKQIRLNGGKTQILTSRDASAHFRVIENAKLDSLRARIDRRRKAGLPLTRDRRVVERRLSIGLSKKAFDTGNGDKILKRLIGLAAIVNGVIQPRNLEAIIKLRPSVRENALVYIRSKPLTPARVKVLSNSLLSGLLVDDASIVEISNHLVETRVESRHLIDVHIRTIINALDDDNFFHLYAKLWLQSKYDSADALIFTIHQSRDIWFPHQNLGRIIGSFLPLFRRSAFYGDYLNIARGSKNAGTADTLDFQNRLSTDLQTFVGMTSALESPNPSRGTGITHSKFLCLLSALANSSAPSPRRVALKAKNSLAFEDVYYRAWAKRTGV